MIDKSGAPRRDGCGARYAVSGFGSGLGLFNAGEFGVDHYSAAVFADDDFLAHLYLGLFLRRNAVEASAAGAALDIDDAETVAGVLADAFESCQCARVDLGLEFFGLGAKEFFVLTGLADDLVELGLLLAENVLAVGEGFFGGGDFCSLGVDQTGVLVEVFLAELDFERLILDLFAEQVEFAVVAHVVELFAVFGDLCLRFVDLLFLGSGFLFQIGDFAAVVLDSGVEAFDIVFEVAHFEGKLAADCLDAVDLRKDCLKLIERFKTLFYAEGFGLLGFGSHICCC